MLYENQEHLRGKIYTNLPYIKVTFDTLISNNVFINVENKIGLPVLIHQIKYNNKPQILKNKTDYETKIHE